MSFRSRCERYAEVDSTMVVARQRAADGAPSGTVVVADAQRQGRGRLGRSWHAPAGAGLSATLILRPAARPDGSPLPILGLAVGVATCAAARQLGATQAMLKWPNDVVLGERKLCGILLEAEQATLPEPVVLVGIGLNVAARASLVLPADLAERYVGLADVDPATSVSVETALAALLDSVELWYERWLAEGAAPVVRAWREADALFGAQVQAEASAGLVVGRAAGISEAGALRIVAAGGVVEVTAGDVVRIRRCD